MLFTFNNEAIHKCFHILQNEESTRNCRFSYLRISLVLFVMDEEPVIKEEPYSDGELDPLQMNSEAAVDSEEENVRNAEPAVSSECRADSPYVPAEDVKGEPESIVVEPNLHLAETDGNSTELNHQNEASPASGSGVTSALQHSQAVCVDNKNTYFICGECGKRFKVLSKLTEHSFLHTGERPYVCEKCNRGFHSMKTLKKHMLIHAGARVISCDVCNKIFNHISALKTHAVVHTGEKPYICNVCGKGFTFNSNLKRHSLTHTGDRPYVCKICNKRFTDITTYKRHSQIHTGETPYMCKVCSKGFRDSSTLKRHFVTHTGEKPYSCKLCNKAFTDCSSLRRHSLIRNCVKGKKL